MKILNTILQQLSQSSTWRGLILLATAFGIQLDPEIQNAILAAGLSLIGLINVVRKS
jgi:hypothetical protein